MEPAARRPPSIATRLFVSAAACSALILLVAGVILSSVYARVSVQTFDERLGVYLRALVADVATPGEEARTAPGQLGEPLFELTLSGWYWQITRLDAEKPEIRASRSLFAAHLPKLEELGVPAGLGGARQGYAPGPDGRETRMVERIIDVGEDGIYLVQVAATTEDVADRIWRFRLSLSVTFALLLVALTATTLLQVRFGLRPLRQLQDGVTAIRRGESEGIGGNFPDDLAPLAAEVNLLIAWNREIVERSRTHVGNLAHALKTPLSVLINEAGRDASPLAGKVREQSQVMSDQVTYYLDRARAAARMSVVGSATDAAPAIEGLLRTFRKIYGDRGVAFEIETENPPRFRGEAQDLQEMVGNLVDNAGKWARSRVVVALSRGAGGGASELVITVDDDGPGLPADQRSAALARGERLDETKPGSGLGLSIVADLAKLHHGLMELTDSPLGGLRTRLVLPAA